MKAPCGISWRGRMAQPLFTVLKICSCHFKSFWTTRLKHVERHLHLRNRLIRNKWLHSTIEIDFTSWPYSIYLVLHSYIPVTTCSRSLLFLYPASRFNVSLPKSVPSIVSCQHAHLSLSWIYKYFTMWRYVECITNSNTSYMTLAAPVGRFLTIAIND